MDNEELVTVIQTGATDRMVELWEQVAGLVAWKARHIMTALDLRGNPCGVEMDDLMQSGYLALVKAVDTYKPTAGSFSTWLVYHLKNTFAELTGYRTKTGRNEPLNNSFSLDKTVDDETDGTPFGEFVSDPKAAATMQGIEDKLWREQLHEAMEAALSVLPEQSAEVLRLRHYQGLTLADVGEIRGTSPERIRQMENKALRQLRKPNIARHLRPFYTFDFYCSTGLGAFQHTGMSIQERYLVIEEDRKERAEQRRKEREEKRQREKFQCEHEDTIERALQEARERVAAMTPEEKQLLLERYGYA